MTDDEESSTTHEESWLLRPLDVVGLPPVIAIGEAGLILGRDVGCDVVLDEDAYPEVSATHAKLLLTFDGPRLVDLGSRNGTHVNGKQIEAALLTGGDIVQLGVNGPRFAIVQTGSARETMPAMPAPDWLNDELENRSPASRDIPARLTARPRGRVLLWTTVVLSLLIAAAALGVSWIWLAPEIRERSALDEMNAQLARDVAANRERFAEQERALLAEQERLRTERNQLLERLGRIESSEATSSETVAALRTQLEEANKRLELFDPIKLEQAKLAGVARVHQAVVLIEVSIAMRDTASGKLLHVTHDPSGRPKPNLRGEGEVFKTESTGSGFVVSADGHILSNAHVVRPQGSFGQQKGPGGLTFTPEPSLSVVFTGTSKRIPAKILKTTDKPDEDLALIQIEPFPGMPVIAGFSLDTPAPPTGSDVFLFGFPLGKIAMQEGDRVIASTFRGIFSRSVGGFLQIDAGVHPGNSGGPVTDASGRVIGVVSRVQSTPDGVVQNAIGYAIPLATVARVWPPAK